MAFGGGFWWFLFKARQEKALAPGVPCHTMVPQVGENVQTFNELVTSWHIQQGLGHMCQLANILSSHQLGKLRGLREKWQTCNKWRQFISQTLAALRKVQGRNQVQGKRDEGPEQQHSGDGICLTCSHLVFSPWNPVWFPQINHD